MSDYNFESSYSVSSSDTQAEYNSRTTDDFDAQLEKIILGKGKLITYLAITYFFLTIAGSIYFFFF